MKVKFKIATLSLVLALLGSGYASAKEAGDFILRSRALYVKPDVSSKVSVIGGKIDASSDQVPEFDFTYFLGKRVAAELILATTKNDISVNGSSLGDSAGLGSVKLLPPTLTLQYHFNPEGIFRPYAGAGLNYTIFYGEKTGGAATSIKYQNHIGYAVQAGFDYMINDKFGLNFDVKKIYLKTHVQVNNSLAADVDLDPWLVGAGLAYHF